MTNKELEKRLAELEAKVEMLSKPVAFGFSVNKQLTINDIEVGGKFVYKGYNYTKLNETNFCIIDDCDDSFMRCMFDPISSNYDESIIRGYINSERFINKLGINLDDLEVVYMDTKEHYDKLALLSKGEYEEYRDLIDDFDYWWATRTPYNETTFCSVANGGHCNFNSVNATNCVRPGLILKPNTPIDRKGND